MTDPRAAKMPERELQENVRQLCAGLGLYHFHPHNSTRSEPGWPDSTIVGRRVLFRELKSECGRLSPEQAEVGRRLKAAGENWRVWRPSDWLSGQIAKELASLAAVQLELFGAAP
jgi:hypothetical protein